MAVHGVTLLGQGAAASQSRKHSQWGTPVNGILMAAHRCLLPTVLREEHDFHDYVRAGCRRPGCSVDFQRLQVWKSLHDN